MRLKERRKVLLPQPEGPISAVISFFKIGDRDVSHGPEVP